MKRSCSAQRWRGRGHDGLCGISPAPARTAPELRGTVLDGRTVPGFGAAWPEAGRHHRLDAPVQTLTAIPSPGDADVARRFARLKLSGRQIVNFPTGISVSMGEPLKKGGIGCSDQFCG